jgi:signal peptidase II
LTPRILTFSTAAGVVVVDQLTKWWVVSTLPGKPVALIGSFLGLHYVTNSGSAFSLFQGAGMMLALAALVAVAVIVMAVRHLERRPEALAMGLVLGGALGNLTDRLFRGSGFLKGEVIDFVQFTHFPAFNAADAAITVGAGLVLLVAFTLPRREPGNGHEAS